MAQAGTSESRFGGPYMIQDRDHMSDITEAPSGAQPQVARQVEQSQSHGRQQGSSDQHVFNEQGSGDAYTARQQGDDRRRQSR